MTTKKQDASRRAIEAYVYNHRDEDVYDKGVAAYAVSGITTPNPHDPIKFPIKHGAWNCGLRTAHRKAFEQRQTHFIANHA
jgi:hypothetical protein